MCFERKNAFSAKGSAAVPTEGACNVSSRYPSRIKGPTSEGREVELTSKGIEGKVWEEGRGMTLFQQ